MPVKFHIFEQYLYSLHDSIQTFEQEHISLIEMTIYATLISILGFILVPIILIYRIVRYWKKLINLIKGLCK